MRRVSRGPGPRPVVLTHARFAGATIADIACEASHRHPRPRTTDNPRTTVTNGTAIGQRHRVLRRARVPRVPLKLEPRAHGNRGQQTRVAARVLQRYSISHPVGESTPAGLTPHCRAGFSAALSCGYGRSYASPSFATARCQGPACRSLDASQRTRDEASCPAACRSGAVGHWVTRTISVRTSVTSAA